MRHFGQRSQMASNDQACRSNISSTEPSLLPPHSIYSTLPLPHRPPAHAPHKHQPSSIPPSPPHHLLWAAPYISVPNQLLSPNLHPAPTTLCLPPLPQYQTPSIRERYLLPLHTPCCLVRAPPPDLVPSSLRPLLSPSHVCIHSVVST